MSRLTVEGVAKLLNNLAEERQRSKYNIVQVSKQDVLIIVQPKIVQSTREVLITRHAGIKVCLKGHLCGQIILPRRRFTYFSITNMFFFLLRLRHHYQITLFAISKCVINVCFAVSSKKRIVYQVNK